MIDKIVEFGYQGGLALDNALVLIPATVLFIFFLLYVSTPLFKVEMMHRTRTGNCALMFIASAIICGFAGLFVNHVNHNEFAIYIDSDGKAVLQKPGSGYHFGFYDAYYFSVEEVGVCKDGVFDFLGNIMIPDGQCEYKSIVPSELVKNVKSLKVFSDYNMQAKYNSSRLLVGTMGELPPPAYINVRYVKPSYK